MSNSNLNQYDDNGGEIPKKINCETPTGTTVVFSEVYNVDKEELEEEIKEEFFWFLELNKDKNYKITINNTIVDYEDYVIKRSDIPINYNNINCNFNIRFVHWKRSLKNEYSRVYYIGSDDNELYKETTKLNKKSDEFYHSVFIQSEYFDEFDFDDTDSKQVSLLKNKNDPEYKNLTYYITDYLIKYRKTF